MNWVSAAINCFNIHHIHTTKLTLELKQTLKCKSNKDANKNVHVFDSKCSLVKHNDIQTLLIKRKLSKVKYTKWKQIYENLMVRITPGKPKAKSKKAGCTNIETRQESYVFFLKIMISLFEKIIQNIDRHDMAKWYLAIVIFLHHMSG